MDEVIWSCVLVVNVILVYELVYVPEGSSKL